MTDPDIELIKLIQGGNQEAFEQLVRRYERPLFSFIYKLLGDRDSAEEMVQEVFLRVYKALPTFHIRPDSKVSSWAFKIAYNLALNEQKRRNRLEKFQKTALRYGEEISRQEIFDTLANQDLKGELSLALNTLPNNQKAALLLRVNDGFSYKEISEILNMTISSIESLIFRARRNLRERLHHLERD